MNLQPHINTIILALQHNIVKYIGILDTTYDDYFTEQLENANAAYKEIMGSDSTYYTDYKHRKEQRYSFRSI